MVSRASILSPFARSIHAKVVALRRLYLTTSQRARILESISDDIKKCTNFVTPRVSIAAAARSRSLGIDLRRVGWHDQPKIDNRRKVFHLEHFNPVSAIRAACLDQRSEDAVLGILRARLKVIWVLKAQDAKLSSLGYRTKRPKPHSAYRAAGIHPKKSR